MSGLAGCWWSSTADESSIVIDNLVHGVSHRGGLPYSSWPAPGLVLTALGEPLPDGTAGSFHESPDVVVTFDGYLTEREELADDIGLPRTTSSAELITRLIRDRGVGGLRRLAGHFAFVAWWTPRNRLLLGRDALGIRPLFIGRHGDSWAWSSALKPLASALGRYGDVDDEFVADYLSRPSVTTRSPFKSVDSVCPGTVLEISSDGYRSSRVWELGDSSARPVAAAEYRERIFAAVQAASTDVAGQIFAELSGGWDSTSIVCIADDLSASGRIPQAVHTISHRYDRSSSSDEILWIAPVERHRGTTGHHLFESNGWLFEELDRAADDDLPSPILCFGGMTRQTVALAARRGRDVLLSGIGGDQITSGTRMEAVAVADRLWNYEVGSALKASPAWSRLLRRSLAATLFEGICLATSPRATRRISGWAQNYLPRWLHQDFVRGHDLVARVAERSWPGDSRLSPGMRCRLALVHDAAVFAWSVESRGARNYVETRFPFLEPRLVDWALRMRYDSITRADDLRAMVREQIGPLLPACISQRKGKRSPDEAILRAVWSQWPMIREVMARPLVVERGYVDGTALQRSLERAYHGAEMETSSFLRTMGLELWLRHLGASAPRRSHLVARIPRRKEVNGDDVRCSSAHGARSCIRRDARM